jgi:hypothetical protein
MFNRMHAPDKGETTFDQRGNWKSNQYDVGENIKRPKYK